MALPPSLSGCQCDAATVTIVPPLRVAVLRCCGMVTCGVGTSGRLDTTTHTSSVMTEMKTGMKMMGKYKSKDEAEKTMASMAECKG
jgi:hypothetical protein